jgi:molecular chaperone DnaK
VTRLTIDYGIDLGTTNSVIAVSSGVDALVIKNNDGRDTTPSAVMIDARGRLYVGQAAYDSFVEKEPDTCVEFKLRMGKADRDKLFASSGRRLSPEELSAEVLKSLRGDVRQATGEDIEAAVITIPAAFGAAESAATSRAAALAGLQAAPLLQEPSAAAQAYGFQTDADNVFWLAYDLGGGTFDAAVVQVLDGEFVVIEHAGDPYLGGKLIDWDIVEKLLIPAVAQQAALPGLARGNQRWAAEVAKLKRAAETAKVRLSRAESADVLVHPPLRDETGHEFEFEFTLRRTDVARLAEPYLRRSVNLCTDALGRAGLGPGDIERVLLIGGPTLAPYTREFLAAGPGQGLGITLDHSQDPLTVVARGAAIFARTQRTVSQARPLAGQLAARLEYPPVGPDAEPLVVGQISGPGGLSLAGFTVEFVAEQAKPPWRSGKIALAHDGSFEVTLMAERGRENVFTLLVHDGAGSRREVDPDRIPYTIGVVDSWPKLTHAIGVGLHHNEVMWLVERGARLPARRVIPLRQAVDTSRSTGLIRIPLLEGKYARADRNRGIGVLELRSGDAGRGVPEDAEIQLTVEIDESRLVTAQAYVPLLQEELEDQFHLDEAIPDFATLSRGVQAELDRLKAVRALAAGNMAAVSALSRIDAEGTAEDLSRFLARGAQADPDAAAEAASRLLDLRVAIDQADDALTLPSLTREAEETAADARELVEAKGDSADRDAVGKCERSLRAAIDKCDADLIRQRKTELVQLSWRVLDKVGELPLLVFQALVREAEDMSDRTVGVSLIARGEDAIRTGQLNELRNINRQLTALLPGPPPEPDPFSTVRRG